MADNSILCSACYTILSLFLLFSCLSALLSLSVNDLGPSNTFTVSSFRYPKSAVQPYDLRYIRVDLPPWFSSLSIAVESDVDLVSPISNASFEALTGSQNVQCYPMQKNIKVELTNEQISPGVWYLGLFNGIGPTRSQSKMIIRSPEYSFSANVSVEGCTTSTMWGQYCNQTINSLSCSLFDSYNPAENISDANFQIIENMVHCKNLETSCHGEGEVKVYLLEVLGVVEQLTIMTSNVILSTTMSNNTFKASGTNLTYYVRHGAVPSMALHDYSGDITGGNIHVRLTSDTKINYEIYARVGGSPSLDNWDYYYANRTRSSDGSAFFLLYNSSEEKVDFYILYVQEGTWAFGLRHLNTTNSPSNDQTIMSVSVERCPRRCSSHGECKVALDASGLTSYSFCSCDRTHGGFDCSIEIVSHRGHIQQSIALIASNAAAVLPAYWALRQKAFAEWVLFTSSGISSGLYHACDVGTWCALSFSVLQFMDFWLSFMAVVSTFVYLTTIDEVYKRTIQTVVAILTALMAITKATRSSNIILVMSIGALGLLIGWLIEFSTHIRSLSFSTEFCLNIPTRWQTIRGWFNNLIKTLWRRFRWGFVLAGFTALTMAAISWKLESSESYWIWHSLWHVTIYSSSFFFLCSKVDTVNSENQRPPDGNYALTRQDSFPRVASVALLSSAYSKVCM
ncbi:hypothetical protein GH714_038701 [Hevea brasiliensis]|uniref:EGF-like domain-containing protein n=1 Tax=Hevea brasiliensis TaxID=3981 RepID=A0A6A6MPX3_HEVBR|nr:hypothetical protein GH714_038701 [Hevea brasiliensis]